MKRTFLCGLICLLSFLLPIPPAMAQNTFSVRLNNRSYDPTYVSVYDHICQIWVYQGQIVNQGMRAISAEMDCDEILGRTPCFLDRILTVKTCFPVHAEIAIAPLLWA